jgi:hypothetical protein
MGSKCPRYDRARRMWHWPSNPFVYGRRLIGDRDLVYWQYVLHVEAYLHDPAQRGGNLEPNLVTDRPFGKSCNGVSEYGSRIAGRLMLPTREHYFDRSAKWPRNTLVHEDHLPGS